MKKEKTRSKERKWNKSNRKFDLLKNIPSMISLLIEKLAWEKNETKDSFTFFRSLSIFFFHFLTLLLAFKIASSLVQSLLQSFFIFTANVNLIDSINCPCWLIDREKFSWLLLMLFLTPSLTGSLNLPITHFFFFYFFSFPFLFSFFFSFWSNFLLIYLSPRFLFPITFSYIFWLFKKFNL